MTMTNVLSWSGSLRYIPARQHDCDCHHYNGNQHRDSQAGRHVVEAGGYEQGHSFYTLPPTGHAH